jgi:hypothetical protein
MHPITANDLKVRGIPAIDEGIEADGEALITVRGKPTYVVLTVAERERLRELELEAALREARESVGQGDFQADGVDAHLRRVTER